MMYGIVVCPGCVRKRIADLKTETSVCPYCSTGGRTKDMKVLFSDKDQKVVRDVLNRADSSNYPAPKKKSEKDPDPLSTLVYEYEHASGAMEKLTVVAEGLSKIKGEFSEKDVEELFPGSGGRIIKDLVAGGLVAEIRYGVYRAL